jgi:membrane protein implicated in regulation of membrane protease activity
MKFDLEDALLLLGVASVVAGIALWSRPAALVVFGGFCLLAVVQMERGVRARKAKSGSADK